MPEIIFQTVVITSLSLQIPNEKSWLTVPVQSERKAIRFKNSNVTQSVKIITQRRFFSERVDSRIGKNMEIEHHNYWEENSNTHLLKYEK